MLFFLLKHNIQFNPDELELIKTDLPSFELKKEFNIQSKKSEGIKDNSNKTYLWISNKNHNANNNLTSSLILKNSSLSKEYNMIIKKEISSNNSYHAIYSSKLKNNSSPTFLNAKALLIGNGNRI